MHLFFGYRLGHKADDSCYSKRHEYLHREVVVGVEFGDEGGPRVRLATVRLLKAEIQHQSQYTETARYQHGPEGALQAHGCDRQSL